ncbi:MAG TPA: hypothetical protein VEI96_09705, partial [Thermodesulfovibrionales bacterium]|nr:hypothetical protein [Thermodesulfovibrionales bacterium]
ELQRTNEGLVVAAEQMEKARTTVVKDIEDLALSFGNLRNEIESLRKDGGAFKAVPLINQ